VLSIFLRAMPLLTICIVTVANRRFGSSSREVLVRQLDAIRVPPLPFVFLSKKPFRASAHVPPLLSYLQMRGHGK
jgi:hypothetical protein